jgi:uncharacterized protein (TIRG00374 family)
MAKNLRSWFFRTISFIIGIGIIVFLIYRVGFKRFADILLGASPYFVVLSFVVYASSWVFRTWRLKTLTDQTGERIKPVNLFFLHIAGYSLNTVFPARMGDAATIGFLRIKGIRIGRAVAIFLQTRILDILALVVLSIPGLVFVFEQDIPQWIVTTMGLGLLVILFPVSVVLLDRNKRVAAFFRRKASVSGKKVFRTIMEKIGDAYDGYREIVHNKKLLTGTTLLSLVIWMGDGLTCYIVAAAVGCRVSLFPLILAVSLANFGKSAPAVPGGFGIYESILASVLTSAGVPFDLAVAVAVLDHAVKKLFNLSVGLPATAGIGLKFRQIHEWVKDKQ